MSKTMLVNVTHVEESRVAILEDGVLSAYEIETTSRTSVKGNIHNAVVEAANASLEAAFVRIGKDTKGFLPLDEVNFKLLPSRSDSRKNGRIGQHLHAGQKIMAQIVREPFAGKPATVSTYFSLPGRYLVLMPGVDSSGVSRKIDDDSQRDRLKKIVKELKPPEGFGVIVRTAGMGQTKTELQRDLRYLLRLWESIQRASKASEFPNQVYREADLVIRTIRDHYTPDISEVWIDNPETYERALAFMRDVMPTRAKSLKLHRDERPLFNRFNLEEQIERIYKRKVPLPSGGEIVIDGTEALTAVDVNSARAKRKGDAEETVTQTNLEAAAEIARQLRLRDLGGLIVIDFIDMYAMKNRRKVEKELREAMKGDRARHEFTRLSKLGLLELSRERLRGAKMAASYSTCSTCDGYGLIKTVEAAGLSALRKLQTRSARGDFGRMRLSLPAEVSTWLLNNKREDLIRLEQNRQVTIELVPKAALLRHEAEFETFDRQPGDEPATRGGVGALPQPPTREERAPAPVEQAAPERAADGDDSPPDDDDDRGSQRPDAGAGDGDDGAPKRRRRRRRGRRGRGGGGSRDAAEDGGAGASTSGDDADADDAPSRDRKTDDDGAAGDDAPPPHGDGDARTDEAVVPRGVRADELMPAASGGRRRRAGGSSSGGKRRRGRRRSAGGDG